MEIQEARLSFFSHLMLVGVVAVLGACGGGDGDSDDLTTDPGGSSEFVQRKRLDRTEISYDTSYYEPASSVPETLLDRAVPEVAEDLGDLLILEDREWPARWKPGDVIVLRLPSGKPEVLRVLFRARLATGELGVAVVRASPLEAFHETQIRVEGTVEEVLDSAGGPAAARSKIVTVVDLESEEEVRLIDVENHVVFEHAASGAKLQIEELSLTATPRIEVLVEIEKPSSSLDWIRGAMEDLADSVETFLVDEGALEDALLDDPVIDAEGRSQVLDLVARARLASDVSEKLEAVLSALRDRSRIRRAFARVDGQIEGRLTLSVGASFDFHRDDEVLLGTVLVPVTGPFPLFASFDIYAVSEIGFDGTVRVASTVDIVVPFGAEVDVVDGELQSPDPTFVLAPELRFRPPSFDGTRAEFEARAGLLCRAGISIGGIADATVDPRVTLGFGARGEVTGDIVAGCADLSWTLDALVEADLSVSLLEIYRAEWDVPLEWGPFVFAEDSYQRCWGGDAALRGVVSDALTGDPVPGVTVRIESAEGTVAQATTDTEGDYLFEEVLPGPYSIDFSRAGYRSASGQVRLERGQETVFPRLLYLDLESAGPGAVEGKIVNSLSGAGIAGAAVELREGLNDPEGAVVVSATTDGAGAFALTSDAGYYTIVTRADGYSEAAQNLTVIGGQALVRELSLSPVLEGDEIRIVLSWGDRPDDLDSHLVKRSGASIEWHVYYRDGTAPGGVANLDRDDTTGFGPETITILDREETGYHAYYVHDYSNRLVEDANGIAESTAVVTVYVGSESTQFAAPNRRGNLWKVFELRGNEIVPVQQMFDESSPSGVGAHKPGAGVPPEDVGVLVGRLPSKR